jgi:hypothetical protein
MSENRFAVGLDDCLDIDSSVRFRFRDYQGQFAFSPLSQALQRN